MAGLAWPLLTSLRSGASGPWSFQEERREVVWDKVLLTEGARLGVKGLGVVA